MSDTNIYDTANQLEREIRESSQYNALKEAFERIQANEISKKLFEEFSELSVKLQSQQMTGQEMEEADLEKIQALTEQVGLDELISDLILKEQQMSYLINDLNRVITQPLSDLYHK